MAMTINSTPQTSSRMSTKQASGKAKMHKSSALKNQSTNITRMRQSLRPSLPKTLHQADAKESASSTRDLIMQQEDVAIRAQANQLTSSSLRTVG